MKKRLFALITAATLSLLVFAGCDDSEKAKKSTEAEIGGDSVSAAGEVTSKKDSDAEDDKSKGFESIEAFTDIFEEAGSYIDDVTSELDSMTLLGELMTLNTIQMITINASLDQVMNGSKDAWDSGRLEMPSGAGQYETSLSKSGNTYIYKSANYYDSYSEMCELVYDTQAMTIDYSGSAGGEMGDAVLAQQYIDSKGNFYVSFARQSNFSGEMSQMVIFYDGAKVGYGYSGSIVSEAVELPIDIIAASPSSWEDLIANVGYDSVLFYDGTDVSYNQQ